MVMSPMIYLMLELMKAASLLLNTRKQHFSPCRMAGSTDEMHTHMCLAMVMFM